MMDDFARSWHLIAWDWLAFIIATCSFVIALISLYVAVKTLESQRQTERNTQPVMSSDIQKFLLEEFFLKLFDGYMHMNALSDVMTRDGYRTYPSSNRVLDNILKVEDIHGELFYSDEDSYRFLQGMRDMAEIYNQRLVSLGQSLLNPSISSDALDGELSELRNRNISIVSTWSLVMKLLFNYSDASVTDLLSRVVGTVEEDDLKDVKLRYGEDFYVRIFSDGFNPEQLNGFMSYYTDKLIEEYNNCMLPIDRRA